MEAAGPRIVLERLKEEWTEVTDATIYKELEFEKQLWMLTALRFLSKNSNETGGSVEKLDTEEGSPKVSLAPSKVLSLHESQGKVLSKNAKKGVADQHDEPQYPHHSSQPSPLPQKSTTFPQHRFPVPQNRQSTPSPSQHLATNSPTAPTSSHLSTP
jgi:hypothetical protein